MVNNVFVLVAAFFVVATSGSLNQQLLVISFDGFRYMYMEDTLLPWFKKFAEEGVYSEKMQSIFPSDTFPNHYAMATGMYAESHGVVANFFYDPTLNQSFSLQSTEVYWWDQASPIWRSARREGKKKVAVSFWPGSEIQFDDGKGAPDYYRKYDANVPHSQRINETVDYLANKKVDLAMLYFNEPDKSGHSDGPGSVLVTEKLHEMDWYLSYILMQLEKAGLGPDKLNMIITADHGMINVTRRLWVGNYVDMDSIASIPYQGAVTSIWPKPGKLEEVYANLTRGSEAENGIFKVYYRETVPADWHYSKNERISPIVVFCQLGIYMSRSKYSRGGGSHGFDPKDAPMQPVFMARGPAFKKGGYHAKNTFLTKDIYAMMTYITGITPEQTNATLENARDIFAVDPLTGSSAVRFASPYLASVFALLLVIFFIF